MVSTEKYQGKRTPNMIMAPINLMNIGRKMNTVDLIKAELLPAPRVTLLRMPPVSRRIWKENDKR